MKNKLFYGFLFLACTVAGFAITFYLLPKTDKHKQLRNSAATPIPNILVQSFEYMSDKDLVKQGKALWQQKKYKDSLPILIMGYHKSLPKSPLRKEAALYLGLQYYYGQGTKKDFTKSYFLLSNPAFSKVRLPVYLVGLMLKDKNFSGYNLSGAKDFLGRAEKMGIKQAGKELDKIGR